jgi:HEAT repeat protein
MAIGKASWKEWWEINRWRFTWMSQRRAMDSGGTEGQSQTAMVDFLITQLGHSYYDIRSASAIGLGKAGDRRAIPALRDLCSDSNKTVKESAILALGMLKSKESVPFMLNLLKNHKTNYRFQVYAAVSLGLVGDHSVARDLMTLITTKKTHDEVQAACLLSLALMKYEPAAGLMTKLLNSSKVKRYVRAMAATALGKLGVHYARVDGHKVPVMKYLLKILQTAKKDHVVRQSAVLAIAALGPTGDITQDQLVTALVKTYGDKNTDVKCLTLMAIAELAKKGKALDKAQYVFRNRLLSEKNQKIKAFAALAAGLSRDRESINVLRKILKFGGNPSLRSAAAVGIGLLKDVGSTEALMKVLNSKTDKTFKGYCCIALGLMGVKDNKEALPKLKEIVTTSSDPELRAAAAVALSQLGDASACKILVDVLEESSQYFKMSAIMAIAAFRDLSSVRPLMDLFNGKSVNDETRAIILVALGHIAEASDVPILKGIGLHYNFLNERIPTLNEIVNLL